MYSRTNLLFLCAWIYNIVRRFLNEMWDAPNTIREYVKIRLLEGRFVFIGAKCKPDSFKVVLDVEQKSLPQLLYMYFYPTEVNLYKELMDDKVQFILFTYYHMHKKHIYVFEISCKDMDREVSSNIVYSVLDTYDSSNVCSQVDVFHVLQAIKDNVRRYEYTVKDVAYISKHAFNMHVHVNNKVELTVCDLETMKEQIFKANDVVYI